VEQGERQVAQKPRFEETKGQERKRTTIIRKDLRKGGGKENPNGRVFEAVAKLASSPAWHGEVSAVIQ
jgi:hypothetical protein